MFTWQSLVKIALFVAVIDGALRKWFFPQLASPLYFFKDVILIVAYFQFFRIYPSFAIPREYGFAGALVVMNIILAFFFAFHPDQPSIELTILSLRHYLIFLPLIWLVPRMFRSQEELVSFLQIYVLTAIPIGLLGFIQYFSAPDSWINRYVGDEEVAAVGFGESGRVRITGTFSYLGGYTLYLSFVFFLAIGLYLNPYQSWLKSVLLSAAIPIIIMNMLMTGSRGPVYNAAITVIAVIIAMNVIDPKRLQRNMRTIVLIGGIVAIGALNSPALNDFIYRAKNSDSFAERGFTPAALVMKYVDVLRYNNLLGEGGGAYHQASWAYMRTAGIPIPQKLPIEDETDRILAEIGPVGFVFWYAMRFAFVFVFLGLVRTTRNVTLRMLALVLFLLHLQSINGHMVFHHTFGLYYWFSVGFIALIPRLEAAEYNRPLMAFYSSTPGMNMVPNPEPVSVATPATANPVSATPGRFDGIEGVRGGGSSSG